MRQTAKGVSAKLPGRGHRNRSEVVLLGRQLRGLGYHIFRMLEDGSAMRVEAVTTLDEAKKQLEALAQAAASPKPSRYFVRDAASGRIVAVTDLGNLEKASA
jgi:hypothetical protein